MSRSHPNRGPKGPWSNPAPEEIRASRDAAGLTQTEAGAVVYSSLRAWQQWEAGDRRMHPAIWAYWLHRFHRLDKTNPRAVIRVSAIAEA